MLQHSFKIALRFLIKRKGISFIHLFDLTIGIAVFWIIVQYVNFEMSYDRFHKLADQIYRVDIDFFRDGVRVDGDAMNYPPTGAALVSEMSEVTDYVRVTPAYGNNTFRHKDVFVEETRVFYADSSMFHLFEYSFMEGVPKGALSGVNKIVLTQSLAEKILGPHHSWQQSLVGEVINLNSQTDWFKEIITT